MVKQYLYKFRIYLPYWKILVLSLSVMKGGFYFLIWTSPVVLSGMLSKRSDNKLQSTLIISKSKGPSKTLQDTRSSTYQICSTEEKTI